MNRWDTCVWFRINNLAVKHTTSVVQILVGLDTKGTELNS